jgi:hypothetical protein
MNAELYYETFRRHEDEITRRLEQRRRGAERVAAGAAPGAPGAPERAQAARPAVPARRWGVVLRPRRRAA